LRPQFFTTNYRMNGEKVTIENQILQVPNNPIIPYIEGDGIGIDIWPTAQKVFDTAVQKVYGDERKIMWKEVF